MIQSAFPDNDGRRRPLVDVAIVLFVSLFAFGAELAVQVLLPWVAEASRRCTRGAVAGGYLRRHSLPVGSGWRRPNDDHWPRLGNRIPAVRSQSPDLDHGALGCAHLAGAAALLGAGAALDELLIAWI